MLLGFISLFLSVTQNGVTKICVPDDWTHHMLPCSLKDREHAENKTSTSHFQTFFSFSAISGTARRLLADDQLEAEAQRQYCARKVLTI